MPPRIPTPSPSPSSFQAYCLELGHALPGASSSSSSSCCASSTCLTPSSRSSSPRITSRSFSTTPTRNYETKPTKNRRAMNLWLYQRQGRNLKTLDPHNPGPRYMPNKARNGRQPFPNNPTFISEPVLSEGARELVWSKVMRDGEALKSVSAELGVDMRRIGAIVRMKEMEKEWAATGKKLATPYSRAILSMVPTHHYPPSTSTAPVRPLESITEITVHPYTTQQLFVPTSESRHFTRADAAKAFHDRLLPADKRVPHPELIEMERDIHTGVKSAEEGFAEFRAKAEARERVMADRDAKIAELEEKNTSRIDGKRFEFRFKEYNVDDVGKDGRSKRGVGWRYGVPFEDRKKDHAKLPTTYG